MDDLDSVKMAEQFAGAPQQEVSSVDRANAFLAGVPPEQGRDEAIRQAVAAHQKAFEAQPFSGIQGRFAERLRELTPVYGPVALAQDSKDLDAAQKRIASGTYSDADLSLLAWHQVRQEAEGQKGIGHKLLMGIGKAAQMTVEQGVGGRLIPGGGGGVIAGTGRLAATTALMPSVYAEAAQQRANEQGGSAFDLPNAGPSFVHGMILNKILGSMGGPSESLIKGIENPIARNVARLGVGAVQFPAEQQLADAATSTADQFLPDAYKFNTKYGVLGELLNGKKGEAGQRFAMEAMMGAIFKAVHAPGAEADRKAAFAAELSRYNDRLEALSRRGMSSQRVFDSATGEMGQERQAEVAQLTKQAAPTPAAAPGGTPPAAQPASQEPAGGTIAPPAGTSAPQTATEAPGAVPESGKPAAQALPVGAAPTPETIPAGQLKDMAAALGLKSVAEYKAWKQKNPAAAEAIEAAAGGRKPVLPEQRGATFQPVETEGPFSHPNMEAGGPRLLAELRAAPEYADIAKAVPEGSKPIGRPNSAFVFETPDGKIVRVGRVTEARPDIPHMIQPESVQRLGRFQVETLPKAERVGDHDLFRQHANELRDSVEALGYKASDLHPDNIGVVNGKVVFIDPAGARPMTTQEREKLAQAQAQRKAAEETPPKEAARSSPPEPAAPPAAPPPKPLTKEERSALLRRGRVAEKAGVDVAGDAKELGVRPELYHAIAGEYLDRAGEVDKEHNKLIDDALKMLDANARQRDPAAKGSKARFLAANDARGGRVRIKDASELNKDGIDNVAEQMAKDYPGQFADVHGEKTLLTDQLFDKLVEGRREGDVAGAYRKAYDELWAHHHPEIRDVKDRLGLTDAEAEAAIRDGVEHAHEARPAASEAGSAEAATGDADESHTPANDSAADFEFGANAVKPVGAAPRAPTIGEVIRQLDSDPFRARFEGNRSRLAIAESMSRRLSGQEPDEGARALGKKLGMSGAAFLKAEASILEKAGFPDMTMQKLRDAEQAGRAELHQGEPEGMSQASREGELSDKKYKQLVGQGRRGERMNPVDREKLLDRMAMDIADKKAAGGDTKSDVELYQKIVEQGLADEAAPAGIGGGQENAPEGATAPKPKLTALANAAVDRERAADGLPPLLRAARQSNPESWDRAMGMLDADPEAGRKLVDELQAKPRTTTVEENALLLHRKVTLRNEASRAVKEYLDAMHPSRRAGYSAEQLDAMEKRYDDAAKQIDDLDKVTRAVGTEWGRSGQFRRQLAAEDYSLHGMLTKAAAAKGRPLTAEEMQTVAEMQKKITDLQAQLDSAEERFRSEAGQTVQTVDRSRQAQVVATSPTLKDMLGIRAQTERAKGQFQTQVARDLAARQPWPKKAADFFVNLRQMFVISSPKTMAKIAAASIARITIAPIEELAGSVLRTIPGIKQIAALAPREGQGFSAAREARSFGSAFIDGARDAWQTVWTGKSNLDATYLGKGDPRSWMDFVGELHAAAKAPAVRAEYTRSFLSRLHAEASKGVDISNPLVVQKAGLEAYMDSQRAKFQQSNAVVDRYNKFVAGLRAPDAGTGANAVGFGLKMALPVVRVPSNIVAEVGEYAFGTVLGSVKAAAAWRQGVQSLKPAEAETIMRQLKKGSIGAAALLVGYFNPGLFGGQYSRDDKRKTGQLQPGEVETPVGAAPNWTQHNPWLEVFQVGASARRVEDSLKRGQPRGLGAGVVEAALGTASEVPFVRETTEVDKLLDPRTRGYWMGEYLKSLAVPQGLSWLAGQLDTNASGEPAKRKPDTALEHIESGVPGLRGNVPLRKK